MNFFSNTPCCEASIADADCAGHWLWPMFFLTAQQLSRRITKGMIRGTLPELHDRLIAEVNVVTLTDSLCDKSHADFNRWQDARYDLLTQHFRIVAEAADPVLVGCAERFVREI
jgi:hypothetical protein